MLLQAIYAAFSAAVLLLGAAVSYWVATKRRHFDGWQTFVLQMAVGSVWQGLFLANVLGADRLVGAVVVYGELGTGIVIAIVWATFVSMYTSRNFHRERWFVAVSALAVVAYLAAAATNPAHSLLLDVQYHDEPFVFASAARGPLYFLLLLFPYGMLAGSLIVLSGYLLSTRSRPRLRVALLVVGAALVGLLNVLSILGLTPVPALEHAALGGVPFLIFTAVGLFRLGLLEVNPVARTALVDALPDPVVVVDEGWRVSDYNREFRAVCPAVDGRTGDPFDDVCPVIADRIETVDLPGPGDDGTHAENLSVPDSDGHRHYSVHVSPVSGPGGQGVAGYALLFRDVTRLEASRRGLEHKNERLEQFASMVSHDLRNPLSVAEGRTELALESAGDDTETAVHLEKIAAAHDRMEAIIDDILLLARGGQESIETGAVELESAAREAWATAEGTEQAALSVRTDAVIRADRSRLLTVLENLFRNAVEHGGRTVTVEVGTTTDDGTRAGFYVADDGEGIPPEVTETVFDPGYTDSEDGTGLGLAIVETVAEAHGWSVSVETADTTGGARFVFSDVTVRATPEEHGHEK